MSGLRLSEHYNDVLSHAAESFNASNTLPISELTLPQWAERVSQQPELVSARELSGLNNDQLTRLAQDFSQSPDFTRKGWRSWLMPLSGGLAAVGGAVLLALEAIGPHPMAVSSSATFAAITLMGAGFAGICASVVENYRRVPLRAAYGRVGLYVSPLHEAHPWLYRTLLLMRDPGAEAYRQRVLSERKVVRGVDYLLMREIAMVSESLVLTRSARSVRERVQGLQGKVPTLQKQGDLVDNGWTAQLPLPPETPVDAPAAEVVAAETAPAPGATA